MADDFNINSYFERIEKEVTKAYDLAERARKNGFDPEPKVDIPIAKNIFERVEGLISAVKPEILGSGVAKRLEELDKQYGSGDWRVGLKIAEEVAKQKFFKCETEQEAMELGVRVGLAYLTMGVVSAPLEGFIEFKIKDRMDGGKYASVYFAGPIRAAGGTAAAVTLLLGDYVRRQFGIKAFDITKEEVARNIGECEDYHERVARLQYFPSREEMDFLLNKLTIEVNGDPTSEREVLVQKNLPRVGTPMIRGGVCLVLCEGLAQKAPKIFKQIKKWGKDFGLEEWGFLEQYLELKTKLHAAESSKKDEKKDDVKIKPSTIFMEEAVAGRPIFSYPMRKGGFRIRYGRSRLTGLAACGFHPGGMQILGKFIASGAQLKIERPGKACAATPCSSIDGPIIKLLDESVVRVKTEQQGIQLRPYVKEILFTGDILISFGEFARMNHVLPPSPYVEEWWIQELQKSAGEEIVSKIQQLDPIQMYELSKTYKVPLHPDQLFFYNWVPAEDIVLLGESLSRSSVEKGEDGYRINLPHDKTAKKILEDICVPHILTEKGILISSDVALGLLVAYGYLPSEKWDIEKLKVSAVEKKSSLELLNSVSEIKLMDTCGLPIGSRLGRPEKAKMRKLNGKPQVLFPVGSEGGKMRSINEALKGGFIEADFPQYQCVNCSTRSIYPKCFKCGSETRVVYTCPKCKKEVDAKVHCGDVKTVPFKREKKLIREIIDIATKRLDFAMPQLVKGVKGTSNKMRVPEPIEKGILRAVHDLYVNKDGTIRYDIIEAPITHFKPKEIGTSVDKLKELGYHYDIEGAPLQNDEQVLELIPQDVILPDCNEWQEASSVDMINKVCSFVDDLLVKYYKVEPYYNVRTLSDLRGQLIIGLAPHTSAGIIGRIIGFSKTQCFYAHPYFHSACRRNCVHPDTTLIIHDKSSDTISSVKIGEFTEELIKKGSRVIQKGDFQKIVASDNLETYSLEPTTKKLIKRRITSFLKGPVPERWVKIKTALGREFTMTPDHILLYIENDKFKSKPAINANVGDLVPVSGNFDIPVTKKGRLDLIEEFLRIESKIKNEVYLENPSFFRKYTKTIREANYISVEKLGKMISSGVISLDEIPEDTSLRIYTANLKRYVPLTSEFMRILGYYASEGHCRENHSTHQVSFRICKKELMDDLISCVNDALGVNFYLQEENTKLTISNKIVYYLFTEILKTGKNAYSKRVPSVVFNSNESCLINYVSSYFDGDGTVIEDPLRIRFYSVSIDLLHDIGTCLSRLGILSRYAETEPRLPGKTLLEKYCSLNKEPKITKLYHLVLGKKEIIKFSKSINSRNHLKRERLTKISRLDTPKFSYKMIDKMEVIKDCSSYVEDSIKEIQLLEENKNVYCLDIDSPKELVYKNVLWGNQMFQIRCDGDELCFLMLMDALLNFSRQYLPDRRGGRTMDAPLVLTTRLDPQEVDDEVYNMDVADIYPLDFYYATQQWKMPNEVKLPQVLSLLGKPGQYHGLMYTHPVDSINSGVRVSSYKTLTTVLDKVRAQMDVAEKVRAVDKADVAKGIIDKHFLKDIKGNLRGFTRQIFRCISCNTKFRRIPLMGVCSKCKGKLVLTISEGTVSKYLTPSMDLAEKYSLPAYLVQTLEILKRRVDSFFGKDPTKQMGLGKFL